MRDQAVLTLAILLLTGCAADPSPPPYTPPGGDYRAPGDSQGSGDDPVPGDAPAGGDSPTGGDTQTGDPGPGVAGESCTRPRVLTWEGSTIVLNDDTRTFHHDYIFNDCQVGQSWHYPNKDLVYRLDFPPGNYRARLEPDWSYTYLSMIDVRTNNCAAFETSCVELADSTLGAIVVWHVFTIAAGETVYLVVDSFGNPTYCEPGMCEGPYELTLEQFVPKGLGESCNRTVDCEQTMICLNIDDVPPGYCTDLCTAEDCATGAIPMICGDVGPVEYHYNTMACVATSEANTLSEYAECSFGYTCDTGLCVEPNGLWAGECRIGCTSTCVATGQSCQEVTADLFREPPNGTLSVCAPTASVGVVGLAGDCVYSYECQTGLFCDVNVCAPIQ